MVVVRKFKKLKQSLAGWQKKRRGTIFVEYLLLLTIVGIGVIVGMAVVRNALINELQDLALAINAINSP